MAGYRPQGVGVRCGVCLTVGVFALAGVVVSGTANPASAQPGAVAPTQVAASDPGEAPVRALIVSYAPGVAPTESPGVVTGSDRVPDVELRPGRNIGFGLRTVTLPDQTPVDQANEIARDLAASPEVQWAEPDFRIAADIETNAGIESETTSAAGVAASVVQGSAPWGLDRIDQRSGLNGQYGYDTTGVGVKAYILDSGMRTSHTEFAGRIGAGAYSIHDGRGVEDCAGHGTHVAGTIGGTTYGVAKQVTLIPVRVLDCEGSGSASDMVAGLNWIAANHAFATPAVLNLSVGGPASNAIDAATSAVIADNITVVAASGNETANACGVSPARLPAVISVNASSYPDDDASFSNFGPCTDIYAPGVNITSAYLTSDAASTQLSGTSMASPHVAGAAARILSVNPSLTPAQVWARLKSMGTPVNFVPSIPTDPKILLYLARPATRPSAPTGARIATFPAARQATVMWGLPVANGGRPVTGYRVQISAPNSATVFGTWTATTAMRHTFAGLVPGAVYRFRVYAVNTVGGSPVAVGMFRQAATPSDVRSARVTSWPGVGKVSLAWVAPAANGGTPIRTYLLRVSLPNSTTRFGVWSASPATTRTLGGLVKNAAYRVQIVAVNSQGNSGIVSVPFRQPR